MVARNRCLAEQRRASKRFTDDLLGMLVSLAEDGQLDAKGLRDEAVENAQQSENQMCGRSWTVGPANVSRGAFLYQLWSEPAYGRSPPVDMRSATAQTP